MNFAGTINEIDRAGAHHGANLPPEGIGAGHGRIGQPT